jgi:hypothetical protein
MESYINTRNGKVFDLKDSINGDRYWYERNYNGVFAYGATFTFSQSFLDDAISKGVLVKYYEKNK